MAAPVLQGNTLGERHRHYNKLLREATLTKIETKQLDFNSGEGDIEKLLSIDVACNNKNVKYILEVLKSEDMLYISRAIKRSSWLVTDPQYANIINPQFLHTSLFPLMTTKAVIKLKKSIRLNMKDESRGIQFYESEKDKKEAVKWLPICPVDFIETEVKQHSIHIKPRLLKRLCEKSIRVLEANFKNCQAPRKLLLDATKFLVNHDPEKYLDVIEKGPLYEYPNFGIKTTDHLMKKCPDKIINKFECYCHYIHLKTFVKYIKEEDAKAFLYDQVMKERNRCVPFTFFRWDCLRHVINRIPKEDRFTFVNEVFINIIHTEHDMKDIRSEKHMMRKLYIACIRTPAYKFYEFAPFNVAFEEVKKLISSEISPQVRNSMLEVLIAHGGRSVKNMHTLLEYYRGKHMNEPEAVRTEFVSKIISLTDFHKLDEKTWIILNDIFKSLDVYIDFNDKQKFPLAVESIIVYEVTHDQKPPEIVEKQFTFNSLVKYRKRLNEVEKDKLLNYLYNYKYTELQKVNILNESYFKSTIDSLNEMLDLLRDWNKELPDYPWVLNKIKELTQMRKNNHYEVNMSSIYNKNKSWKKYMFEESIELFPSQEVFVNLLKHDSQLLATNEGIVQNLCRDDNVSLTQFLKKVRIYWSESLACKTTGKYLERVTELEGHKALLRGLCALLSRHRLNDFIQKYAPQQAEIDWSKIDELELSLQRHIAKNMHFARPQPSAEAILLYTKGDYLKYALPSLLAIFYNFNAARIREHIPNLLDAPVSVQKHGIRLAYDKLPAEELHQLFSENWTKTKNATIRSITFKYTYDLLTTETNPERVKDIWKSLATFIDCLSYEEDKKVYELLTNVEKIPLAARPEYFVKSYEFLKRLHPKLPDQYKEQYKQKLYQLATYARELVELLPSEFIESILLEYISEKYLAADISYFDEIIKLLTAYLLCSKTQAIQSERYDIIFKPLLQQCFASWDKMEGEQYYIRKNFQTLLAVFRKDLKYVVDKHLNVPVQMYTIIENEVMNLPIAENYIMLTKWKLTVELAKILNKNNCNGNWDDTCSQASLEFGDTCLRRLKQDMAEYFPAIYLLFAKVLEDILQDFQLTDFKWQINKCLLSDEKCIQAYLALIKTYPQYHSGEEKQKAEEIRKILWAHPSIEVKMHCYHKFGNDHSQS